MKKQVCTMKDVAKLAGVTQPTVSHVINGTASISKDVCDRVNAAIEALQYRPNALAKGLKTNTTKTIGLIVPDITNSYYACIAKEVEQMLVENGYISFLSCTDYDVESEQKIVDKLMRYSVDGIFVMCEFLNREPLKQLKRYGVPTVTLDDCPSEYIASMVYTDNELGGYLATRHLIDRGRKRIAYLGEKVTMRSLQTRFEGYRRALLEAGLSLDEEIILLDRELAYRFDAGLQFGKKLADKGVDGVFASTDMIALGVARAFFEAGIRVPEDIALVGYDNIPLAELWTPALTTVTQPSGQIAEAAIEQLFLQIEGKKHKCEVKLMPELIVRETA
jgi:LacI family transcriptional regulator